MKGLLPKSFKNSIHPNTPYKEIDENETCTNNSTTNLNTKDEISLIIPLTNELNYFERRLNNVYSVHHSAFDPLDSLSSLSIQRCQRPLMPLNGDEPYKFTVFDTTVSINKRPIYFVAEQTEYFIKSSCFHTFKNIYTNDNCLELEVSYQGGDPGLKLFVEFGPTGFCNKIFAIQHNRLIGSTSKKYLGFSTTQYSLNDYLNKQIMEIKSTSRLPHFLRKCFKNTNEHLEIVSCGKNGRKFVAGKIERNMDCLNLSLFHGIDSISKFLLISAIILIDLQSGPKRRGGYNLFGCLFQCLASICIYFLVVIIVLSVIIIMVSM